MRTAIIYHNADWDGLFSAVVALDALRKNYKMDIDLIGWSYGMAMPEFTKYDAVYLLDLSFPLEVMRTLDRKLFFVWIDHHKKVIEDAAAASFNPEGVRDTSYAACELTWDYFHEGDTLPTAIRLVGEYDIFNRSGRFCRWESALAFQIWMRTLPLTLEQASAHLSLCEQEYDYLIERGEGILAFKRQEALSAWAQRSLGVTAPDGEKGLLLFTHDTSSLMTEALFDEHAAARDIDFVLMASLIGSGERGMYHVSVRVPEWSSFDAARFAARYGGGGHVKAAGCRMTQGAVMRYVFDKNAEELSR